MTTIEQFQWNKLTDGWQEIWDKAGLIPVDLMTDGNESLTSSFSIISVDVGRNIKCLVSQLLFVSSSGSVSRDLGIPNIGGEVDLLASS